MDDYRAGHEVPGIRGVYSHVSPPMRADLVAALEERWQASLQARTQIAPCSSVHLLDELLATQQVPEGTIDPFSRFHTFFVVVAVTPPLPRVHAGFLVGVEKLVQPSSQSRVEGTDDSPRHRLRPLPQRPHRLDLTLD